MNKFTEKKLDKYWREKINRPRNLEEFIEFFENWAEKKYGKNINDRSGFNSQSKM